VPFAGVAWGARLYRERAIYFKVECGAVVVVGIVCQHAVQERFAPIPIWNGPERKYPGYHFEEYPQLGSNVYAIK
jgi:hypothetical protein